MMKFGYLHRILLLMKYYIADTGFVEVTILDLFWL